jgi:hypothetical protein
MKICKVDWKLIESNIRKKLLKLAPNKSVDDFYFMEENKSFVVFEKDTYMRPVGCHCCLDESIGQDEFGNKTIGNTSLLNYKNLIDTQNFPVLNDAARYISDNVWLCPNCGRWIFDFLPKYINCTKEIN